MFTYLLIDDDTLTKKQYLVATNQYIGQQGRLQSQPSSDTQSCLQCWYSRCWRCMGTSHTGIHSRLQQHHGSSSSSSFFTENVSNAQTHTIKYKTSKQNKRFD